MGIGVTRVAINIPRRAGRTERTQHPLNKTSLLSRGSVSEVMRSPPFAAAPSLQPLYNRVPSRLFHPGMTRFAFCDSRSQSHAPVQGTYASRKQRVNSPENNEKRIIINGNKTTSFVKSNKKNDHSSDYPKKKEGISLQRVRSSIFQV